MIFSKASGVNDSAFGKSQEPIRLMIEQQEESYENNSIIPSLFYQDTTDTFAAKYTMETSLGNFAPVGENGKPPKSDFREGYSKVVEPDEWKNSFEVTEQMLEDAVMGKVKSKTLGFMLSYGRTRERFGAAIYNNGQATTMTFGGKTFNIASADGLPFFSTAHTSITGNFGNQSNYFGNAFSYDALCLVEEQMQNFRDDDGNFLNIQPDTIVIPNKARIKKQVMDAIGAEGIPGTANNSFSYQYGRWNVVFSPELTSAAGITAGTDSWWLLDSKYNEAYAGAVWLDRVPLQVRSYIDNETGANVFVGRTRYSAAPNNWRFAAKVDPGLGTVLTL